MSRSKYSILDDELREFCLEKDVKTSVKSPEEIERATVDETLNDLDRAVHLLSLGQQVQCISVIRNLPTLLKMWQSECVQKVIPKLKDLLKNAGLDVQLVGAEIFTLVAKEEIFSPAAFTQYFLPIILKNINLKDPGAAQAWLTCLKSAIAYLSMETVQKEILGLVISRSSLTKPVATRLTSCALMGAVAGKVTAELIKKEMMSSVRHLCQDIDFGVRACMSAHLHSVATALGAEETKKLILPDVLELAVDEEFLVQGAALDCLIRMRSLLDEKTIKDSVVPLVCQYCQTAVESKTHHLVTVAENFGEFCHNLSDYVTPQQRCQLLDAYCQLCKFGRSQVVENDNASVVIRMSANKEIPADTSDWSGLDRESRFSSCRRHCAYNFPAVTLFCGATSFESKLFNILSLLCTDRDVTVRKFIASGFHEVALALDNRGSLVFPHLLSLFKETQSSVVLEAFVKELPQTLVSVVLCGNLEETETKAEEELSCAYISCISQLEENWPCAWRALSTLVFHLNVLPDIFSPDVVYAKFVPVAFKLLLHNHYLPVRRNAAISLCKLLHRNRRYDQRTEMCYRLVQDLCYSSCFRHRLMFLTVCYQILDLFSKAYFKENFFPHLLKLFEDSVPNVRLSACALLPSMKAMLHLPNDRYLHAQTEIYIKKLTSSEPDRDVVAAVKAISAELDQIKAPFVAITHPFDEDRVKEDDEQIVAEMEEKRLEELARVEGPKVHTSFTFNSIKGKSRGSSRSTHSLGVPSKTPNCSPNQSRLRVNNGLFAVDQLHPVAKVRGSVSATSRSYSTARETKDGKFSSSFGALSSKKETVNEVVKGKVAPLSTHSTSTKTQVKSPAAIKKNVKR